MEGEEEERKGGKEQWMEEVKCQWGEKRKEGKGKESKLRGEKLKGVE